MNQGGAKQAETEREKDDNTAGLIGATVALTHCVVGFGTLYTSGTFDSSKLYSPGALVTARDLAS